MANQLSIKHNGLIQFYVIEIFLEIFRSFIFIMYFVCIFMYVGYPWSPPSHLTCIIFLLLPAASRHHLSLSTDVFTLH